MIIASGSVTAHPSDEFTSLTCTIDDINTVDNNTNINVRNNITSSCNNNKVTTTGKITIPLSSSSSSSSSLTPSLSSSLSIPSNTGRRNVHSHSVSGRIGGDENIDFNYDEDDDDGDDDMFNDEDNIGNGNNNSNKIHTPSNNNNNNDDDEISNDGTDFQRHLTLFDLITIGVGGTVGSGIFVLCGFVARNYAGPATCLSWIIAGFAALLSGCCYAELGATMTEDNMMGVVQSQTQQQSSQQGSINNTSSSSSGGNGSGGGTTGGSYVYARRTLGEMAGAITGACLTLEYLVSGAAVARSWGDKVVDLVKVQFLGEGSYGDGGGGSRNAYYHEHINDDDANGTSSWTGRFILAIVDPQYGTLNPPALFLSASCTLLLLRGVKESKRATRIFTWLKVCLVLFMIVGGFILMDASNLTPFFVVPYDQYDGQRGGGDKNSNNDEESSSNGFSGVIRGATSCFFGYIGFDSVCCVAGEAKNPKRDVPRAVLGTLGIVSILYISAALALVGMVPYTNISPTSGFPDAFGYRNVGWAAALTAFGEVVTLPIVVLLSLMLQPRLQYAMAKDGLLPPAFAEVRRGVPYNGTIWSGVLMTFIAAVVPFSYLDDFVSAGILLAFTITNCSLVVMRYSLSSSSSSSSRCTDNATNSSNGTFVEQGQKPLPLPSSFVVQYLMYFHVLSFLSCLLLSGGLGPQTLGIILLVPTVGVALRMRQHFFLSDDSYDDSPNVEGSIKDRGNKNLKHKFSAPFVPLLPCLGSFVNIFLITRLETIGIILLVLYLGLTVLAYLSFCGRRGTDCGLEGVIPSGIDEREIERGAGDEIEMVTGGAIY